MSCEAGFVWYGYCQVMNKLFGDTMNRILYNKITFTLICLVTAALLSSFIYHSFVIKEVTPLIDNELDADYNNTIQLNIMNGSGESGLAAKAKQYYRKRNFDVVEVGNFKFEAEKTLVIDRVGDMRSAYKVANAIGIPDSMVSVNIDSTMYLRTTLVIGKDWKSLKVFK